MNPVTTVTVPAHVAGNPRLGTWITVRDQLLVIHLGKVELGQGILTALAQVAADALGVPLAAIRIAPAHTREGPDQGLTAGSLSVLQTGPALRYVGAVVRTLVGQQGAEQPLAAFVEAIATLDPDTDLREIVPAATLAPKVVGLDVPRLDLPDKVLGRPRYLSDLRPPGLLHGRILRPPSPGASLQHLDEHWSAPGVQLVRDGSFVGLVGEREVDLDRGLAPLAASAAWTEQDLLPDQDHLSAWLQVGPHEEIHLLDENGTADPGHGRKTVSASYSKPFLTHASIGPSCAMARWDDDGLQVWSHSQGIHSLRDALAATLSLAPADVVVEHVENAGCYGHNGADDAALDAALLARAVPHRPVLTRWSRADELTCGPLSSAMTATVSAGLHNGIISGWSYDVWSQGHTARPGARGAPALLAGADLADPVPLPQATDPPDAAGGGTTRNAVPIYAVGPRRVTGHRRLDSPLRTSAMRALGAYLNVFAIESFMDELAGTVGADPVAFRLAHLQDPRAVAVIQTAARLAGWGEPLGEDAGRGIGFARYKGTGAWCAVVAQVAVETHVQVERLTVVADIGRAVNPDGARNQLQGGAVQATSWTTLERVRFDRRRITSDDWETYPILRFSQAPLVGAHLIDSDAPSLGAGEAAQGPTAAAIANAVYAALGVRVRDLPLDATAIVRAIEAQE